MGAMDRGAGATERTTLQAAAWHPAPLPVRALSLHQQMDHPVLWPRQHTPSPLVDSPPPDSSFPRSPPGREGPGKAFRLYTEAAFAKLAPSTAPEILRTNLSSVVLQLKALGVRDVLGFDFLDPPPAPALVRSLELLLALGALTREGDLAHPIGERGAVGG